VWEPSRALAVGFLSDREYVSKQRNRCEGKGVDRVVGAGIGATGTVLDARMTQRWVIGSSRVRVGGCLVVVVVVGGLYCPAWHVVCAGVSEPKGKTDRQTDRQSCVFHTHTHTPTHLHNHPMRGRGLSSPSVSASGTCVGAWVVWVWVWVWVWVRGWTAEVWENDAEQKRPCVCRAAVPELKIVHKKLLRDR
jgi:hypothetical protein